MYHCHIRFYLIGGQDTIFEAIKEFTPLEQFTHTFWEDYDPETERIAQADVLFVDLQEEDAEKMLQVLAIHKKKDAEIILLADKEQAMSLSDSLPEVEDIWILPLSEQELGFRFERWQRNYKLKRDLWEARQFMDVCINSSPSLVWFKDKEGIHEIVNESLCKTVNKTREQVKGRRHPYVWDVEQDNLAYIESEVEVMWKKKTCMSMESIHTANGAKKLTIYRSPLYDWDGSVMGTVGIAVDVTTEYSYRQELIEKNQAMDLLFTTLDCGVMCHSIDGTQLISINQAALRLLGYESREEMMADGFDLVAKTVVDKKKLRESISSLTKVGESASVEYRVRHKDGKELYILGNVKLIERKGKLYYQRFILDFTAHKLMDEQKNQKIQYQERMFEIFSTFLSDNVNDVYMMLNAQEKKAEFVSPNVERVLGVPWKAVMDDVTQLGIARYFTGKPINWEDMAALEPGMSLETMETERIDRKTGERKWFRESVYCVLVQGIRKIVIYISDRTKEKQTQNNLSEALNMAQTASKAKSVFLGNVSHDIRTPLNAIMGFIPLLQEEAGNPESVLEYTQKISAASKHLLELVNDVLDLNKIESGSAILNISELNLAEIIDEVDTIIRPQAAAKKQTFEIFAISLTNEHLLGDRQRITQILMNILSNAVKYTPDGGHIRMMVDELPPVDAGYSHIRFTVSDNGFGMSEEFQKVLFEPFSREQHATRNETQGTGLGMPVTKGLVKLMNGSIKVKSKSGVGTTFVIELNLRNQNRKDNPDFQNEHGHSDQDIGRIMDMKEKKTPNGTEENLLTGIHALVVDDNPVNRMILVKLLMKLGAESDVAEDGQKAVETFLNAPADTYDVILMDLQMPVMDGYEASRTIRASSHPFAQTIPILAVSANAFVDDVRNALDAGMNVHVAKPIIFDQFKKTLLKELGKSSAL